MSYCRSRLVELDEEGYSSGALDRLADGRAFPVQLDFDRSEFAEIAAETMEHISISGVQEKLSLRLERGNLKPVEGGGHYILKPIPGTSLPRHHREVPANEHLTMQIAEQVYRIDTAANACIELADGEPAYITRRFDRTPEGGRIAQEDFCQLMGRTKETHGKQYKYSVNYEALGETMRRFCPAYAVELEKFFRQIVFNYAFANGDAHLKNFSLFETEFGDYVLTPAYDLMCTKLHMPNETRFALDFFKDGEMPASRRTHGFVTGADFLELADRLGLKRDRAVDIVDDFCDERDKVAHLISRSFLSAQAREDYRSIVRDRRKALSIRTTS